MIAGWGDDQCLKLLAQGWASGNVQALLDILAAIMLLDDAIGQVERCPTGRGYLGNAYLKLRHRAVPALLEFYWH